MSEHISPTNRCRLDLEEIVERFEDAWHTAGEPCVEDHLPPSDHPHFDEIAVELLCIDLERRAKSSRAKSVEEYREDFPELLGRTVILESLAFEEYRLLSSIDGQLDPSAFSRKYGIRTQHWPRAHADRDASDAMAHSALTNGVADEMDRIASLAQMPKIGEQFLNFELVDQLGKCHFGRVFLARQKELSNRHVVIKVTSNVWLESDRLARLQHTNIVPVYSVHEHKGLQAVCMPFLGKQTLASISETYHQQPKASQRRIIEIWSDSEQPSQRDRSRLRQQEGLARLTHEELCTWIIAKVAAGLSQAHDRGILHRDLKPANILMTDDLRPMILDFNLSEDAVAGGRSSLLIGGTLPYMSPEHLMAVVADGEVDERSDLYSMGVMLFQLLTGRLPFEVPPSSTVGALSYLLNDRPDLPPSVRMHDQGLSTDIESIVMRCLASNPAERYQAARELQDDLERHVNSLPPMHAPIRSRKEQFSKWAKRHPRATSATVLVLVGSILLTMLTFFCFLRGREVARLGAWQAFQQFKVLELSASGSLSVPDVGESALAAGLHKAKAALEMLGANDAGWMQEGDYRLLSTAEQTEVRRRVARLRYLVAATHLERSANRSSSERDRLLHLALGHNERAMACELPVGPALRLQQDAIKSALGRAPDSRQAKLNEIQNGDPDTSSGLLLAMHHMRNRDFADAEAILLTLNRDRPKDPFIWLVLGNCKYGLKQPRQAASCFTSSITLLPSGSSAHFLRGICRMESKELAAAEDDFTKVILCSSGNTAALVNRALVRIATREYREALEDLTRAIDAGRDDSLVYIYRARVNSALGNTDDAARDVEASRKKTPVCVKGWIHRGLVVRQSSPEAALHDFDAALRLDSTCKQALQNKVALLSQLNRNEDAIESISELVRLSPNDATVLLGRGLLYARLGFREPALADCELALKISESPSNHYQTARILANTSRESPADATKAALHLRKALQGTPQLVANIRRDPDLRSIVNLPDLQSLLAAVGKLMDEAD